MYALTLTPGELSEPRLHSLDIIFLANVLDPQQKLPRILFLNYVYQIFVSL